MIYQYPAKEVTTECTELKEPELIKQVIKCLRTEIEILTKKGRGVLGLAAPQIGLPYRIFIAEGEVYVNPHVDILSRSSSISSEACFSVEGSFNVRRYDHRIHVRYFLETGLPKEKVLEGHSARVFLHEFDHINGLTIATQGMSDNSNLASQDIARDPEFPPPVHLRVARGDSFQAAMERASVSGEAIWMRTVDSVSIHGNPGDEVDTDLP